MDKFRKCAIKKTYIICNNFYIIFISAHALQTFFNLKAAVQNPDYHMVIVAESVNVVSNIGESVIQLSSIR